MEVLSRKTYVETGKSFPKLFMTAKQLSEYEGHKENYYRTIFREIDEQIKDGRYSETAMGDGDPQKRELLRIPGLHNQPQKTKRQKPEKAC